MTKPPLKKNTQKAKNNSQKTRRKPTNRPQKTTKTTLKSTKTTTKSFKKPQKSANSRQNLKKTSLNKRKTRSKSSKNTHNIQKLWWPILKFISYWLAFLTTLGIIAGMAIFFYYSVDLPDPDGLKMPTAVPTVTIVTSDDEVLTHRAAQQSGHIAFKLIPKTAVQALIAIEDRGFYNHNGVDIFGIMRAAMMNIMKGRNAQGGSTLTQQLAKMLYLKPEKKLKRKVQEAMLAIWLESKYSKEKLLEFYFNRAYFGAGANGLEAAAQKYFNKSARYLTLGESAMLAGLMKAPSRYNPLNHPKNAKKRQILVLNAMAEEGYISQATRDKAIKAPLGITQTNVTSQGQYAADWIMRDLRGYAGDISGDIRVETTIDPYLQQVAEISLNDMMDKVAKHYKAEQAALILMDKTGAVRALVGGRNYGKSAFNRVLNAQRQPGSVFKPFVYLAALEQGYKPTSKLQDAPIKFKNWRPKNYNNKYYGSVTLTHSLAKSMNSVALRLAKKIGSKTIIETTRRLGITSPLRQDLSLALGTSEVNLLELTAAYLPFMNNGLSADTHIIQQIKTEKGKNIYRHVTDTDRIISVKNTQYMNNMLYAVTNWGTGKKAQINNFKSYGKTGTTQNYKDGWFIGYTSEYIAGVWVGNDNGTATNKVTGGNIPAQIWHDLMAKIHQGLVPQYQNDNIGDLLKAQ